MENIIILPLTWIFRIYVHILHNNGDEYLISVIRITTFACAIKVEDLCVSNILFEYFIELKTLFKSIFIFLHNKTTNRKYLSPTQNQTRAFYLTQKKAFFHKTKYSFNVHRLGVE